MQFQREYNLILKRLFAFLRDYYEKQCIKMTKSLNFDAKTISIYYFVDIS